jgi:hypothetical protein
VTPKPSACAFVVMKVARSPANRDIGRQIGLTVMKVARSPDDRDMSFQELVRLRGVRSGLGLGLLLETTPTDEALDQ